MLRLILVVLLTLLCSASHDTPYIQWKTTDLYALRKKKAAHLNKLWQESLITQENINKTKTHRRASRECLNRAKERNDLQSANEFAGSVDFHTQELKKIRTQKNKNRLRLKKVRKVLESIDEALEKKQMVHQAALDNSHVCIIL